VGYYANAFFSASRSVIWVLNAECQNIPGYPEWYKTKSVAEEEKKFFKSMNDARIRSVKKESIALRAIVTITVPEPDQEDTSSSAINLDSKVGRTKTMKIPFVSAGLGKAYIRPDLAQTTKELDEFRGEDIVEVADRYIKILTEIVEECRARFFA